MEEFFNFLSQTIFWNEHFWLPVGYSWKHLEADDPSVYYPKLRDIITPSIGLGFLLIGVRYLLERHFFYRLGLRLGVKIKKVVQLEKNDFLERTYQKLKHVDPKTEQDLVKKTGLDGRQIQRWFRHRRNKDVQGPMKKFCECGWLSSYYYVMVIYALIILWNKPWFWKSILCYDGWPVQPVPSELYWYYLIEMSFYWSLLITLLYDTKRKDFWQMAAHHMLTLSLMTFSWAANTVRIGALVLFLHDIADSWIGIAKMAKYCNRQTACEILFGWFILIWIITRVGIYPYWILMNVIFESRSLSFLSMVNCRVLFVVLLVMLQFLHWMWTYMILGIAIQKLSYGQLKQDTRSESDGEEEGSDENENDEKDKVNFSDSGVSSVSSETYTSSEYLTSSPNTIRQRNQTA